LKTNRSTARGVQLLSGEYKSLIWSTSEELVGVQINAAIEDGGSWFSVKRNPAVYNIE
jgi:hypothetical protein